MALELKPRQILTTKLAMTPQLQLAIKLLQLSRLELVGTIQQELTENPVLEKVEEPAGEKSDADWQSYFEYYSPRQATGSETEVKDSTGFETYTSSKLSLTEHLLR